MNDRDQAGLGWTVVLRRQPVRIVEGWQEGGYTDVYELVCCDCGDHPGLDYREVPAELQRIRGPYRFAEGVAAYQLHIQRNHGQRPAPSGPSEAITVPAQPPG